MRYTVEKSSNPQFIQNVEEQDLTVTTENKIGALQNDAGERIAMQLRDVNAKLFIYVSNFICGMHQR